MEVAHIVAIAQGGNDDPSNVAIVCPNCHAKSERGFITLSPLSERKSVEVTPKMVQGAVPNIDDLQLVKHALPYPNTAILTLENRGSQPAEIVKYSVDRGQIESVRSPPLRIEPRSLGDLPVTIARQGFPYRSGKEYEIMVWTRRGWSFMFRITF